jgi:hypothetical protein
MIPEIDVGPVTSGPILGRIDTGARDETVLNSGAVHDVRLGSGNDTYTVGGFIFEDFRDVAVSAESGDVRGQAGNETISGGFSDETFFGGSGDGLLVGYGGRDNL